MDSTNTALELLVQQAENVLTSLKDLKLGLKKKGKARFDLYERFCANQHSFDVYTFMDPEIQESAEVTAFKKQLESFREDFAVVRTDLEAVVDIKHAEAAYEEVFANYNVMVNVLGFPDRQVNAKKF
ncbi:hypothetical protein [Rummeliibacillus pycnus]|uniref:hypothetical protein n=1 Tax=Rummeliibacillus pycnus TaxID=101070 RepID=UPI000C9C2C4E|nr:hypothetical protein [Rummeliibacillus pycnus]